MGGWFRKVLVFLILVLGLGIPIGYWVKGEIARAESRKPLHTSPSFQVPPPLDVKLPPMEPLRASPLSAGAPKARKAGAALELAFKGKAWRTLPQGTLTILLRGPGGASRALPLGKSAPAWKDLPPGKWTILVVPSPPGKGSAPLWKAEVELPPGEEVQREVPPPALASLEGKVILAGKGEKPAAPEGLQIRLFTQGGVRTTRTGPDGSFSIEGLLPGKALLMAAGGPSSAMGGTCQEIILQGGTRSKVTLELRR